MELRHVAPGRCLLRQPIEPGEVQRVPRDAPRRGQLVGYYIACPACGARRIEEAGAGPPFEEGPTIQQRMMIECSDGTSREVAFWVPSTLSSTRIFWCRLPRCGVRFQIRDNQVWVISSRSMDAEKHQLLAEIDEALQAEHREAMAAWRKAVTAEVEAAKRENRQPNRPPMPSPPASMANVVFKIAMDYSVTVDDLVSRVLGHAVWTVYPGDVLEQAVAAVPEDVRARLMTLQDRWAPPPAPPPPPPPAPEPVPEEPAPEAPGTP